MREETRQKLDRLHSTQRRAKWILAAVAAAVVLSLAFVIGRQPLEEVREVEAVVQVGTVDIDPMTGQRNLVIESKLPDGRLVRATTMLATPPQRGDTIILTERTGWFGFYSYHWNGRKN
jgi:hypothetical protein